MSSTFTYYFFGNEWMHFLTERLRLTPKITPAGEKPMPPATGPPASSSARSTVAAAWRVVITGPASGRSVGVGEQGRRR
jgi:hypothetical protein